MNMKNGSFQKNMFLVIDAQYRKKWPFTIKSASKKTMNFVENLSSQTFEKAELQLLNKVLKFALSPSSPALDDIIIMLNRPFDSLMALRVLLWKQSSDSKEPC